VPLLDPLAPTLVQEYTTVVVLPITLGLEPSATVFFYSPPPPPPLSPLSLSFCLLFLSLLFLHFSN